MARKNRPNDPADAAQHPPQVIPAGPVVDFETMMPGYRKRHDGWNQHRVQRFLDVLAHTGCVEDACRVAGMSDVAPYRAKKKYPLFSEAWDAALDRSQKGLIAIAYKRAVEGKETVIIRKGEEYERRIAPSDSMLSLLVKRGDMRDDKVMLRPENAITFEEWSENWTFDAYGKKVKGADPAIATKAFNDRMDALREKLLQYALDDGTCVMCNQPWPADEPRSMAELVASGVISMDALIDCGADRGAKPPAP